MNRALYLLLPVLLSVGPICLQAQAPTREEPAAVLNPGDRVRLTIWRKPELSGEFRVAGDSSLVHPLYRHVKVAGVPIPEAEQRLINYLHRYEANPQVVIETFLRVAVGGEVRQAGMFEVPPATTVAQVVAQAGGPSERGNMRRVRLIRNGQTAFFDLSRPETAVTAEVPVRSGDQVIVGRRIDVVRDYMAPASSITSAAFTLWSILRSFR